VLDRGKLSRILTIVEQRITEASLQFVPGFEVELKNEKKLVLRSAQEVFALDNSVKNPIRKLIIRVPMGADKDGNSDDEGESGIADTRVKLRFDSDKTSNIMLNVASPDSKFATELSAELEEHIDRTLVTNWIIRFFKSENFLFFFAAIVVTGLMAMVLQNVLPFESTLSSADSVQIQHLLSEAKTDTEKIDALVQTKLRELKGSAPSASARFNWTSILSLHGLFIALPILILVVTVSYMIVACYPWAVFAWGDYEQHYTSLVARRKTIGIVVVAALVIGIVANLFVANIPPLK
jgi:hypothetical protein